jgi:hypothetical protein
VNPLDAFVDAEWRRICAPRVKPPKLDAIAIPIIPRRDEFASMKAALDDGMRQIDHATRPASTLMEQAVRVVFVFGYQPADCCIETQGGLWTLADGSIETRRLVVRGSPCFEVRIHRSPMVDCKFTITVTPRLIAWPPNLSTPGHQHTLMTDAP